MLTETLAALSPRELGWRDSKHALESSEQREPTQPDSPRHRIQRDGFVRRFAQYLRGADNLM